MTIFGMLLTYFLFQNRKFVAAGIVAALAMHTKFLPIFLAGFLALELLGKKDWRSLGKFILPFLLVNIGLFSIIGIGAVSYLLNILIGKPIYWQSLPQLIHQIYPYENFIFLGGFLIFGLAQIWRGLTKKTEGVVLFVETVLVYLLFFANFYLNWYVLWLLPFVIFIPWGKLAKTMPDHRFCITFFMINFLKKHKTKFLIWVVLIFAFLTTRLINLGLIPIFTDEAIYLRWSQIIAYDAGLRYLPLVDGKPPLFMWLTAIGLRLFSGVDPLIVLRLISVGSGLFGLTGIYFASWQLFKNKKISYLSVLLYLLVPFTFFYDRFGLADTLLAALGLWSLGLGVLLVRTLHLDIALLLGGTIGLGLLTKMPAFFFLLFLPVLMFIFNWQKKNLLFRLLKITGL
ncbi:glycosyltransferase family 39 protein, partial [Candidatus Gottesmanbacteria bacterium]|nr:glycosyltransferase family 39 protein [Candidatus Gottesmanbacteria bacterium]